VRFFSVTGLVTQLLEAREDRQPERLFKRLEKLQLLILDEFGYVPFSKTDAELLFEVVSRAYERQSIILTTNLPFEHWTEILGNERLTGGAARSHDPSRAYHRGQRRELPPSRCQKTRETRTEREAVKSGLPPGGRPATRTRTTNNSHLTSPCP